MRNRFISTILAVVAVLAISPVILAQTATPSGTARVQAAIPKPDLSGVWTGAPRGGAPGGAARATGRPVDLGGGRRFSPEEPPLRPLAMEIYKVNRAGVTDPNEQGLDALDPSSGITNLNCAPPGPTRAMILRQFEIVQLPAQLLILFEWDHWVRRIFLDGRGHPEAWPFGWMGHSIGKWDGDILVADTIGVNDQTWLDGIGTPHSDALHVVERFRRANQDTLEIEFLFEDPNAFTKPWGGRRLYQLRPNLEILEHVMCDEYVERNLDEIRKMRQTWPAR